MSRIELLMNRLAVAAVRLTDLLRLLPLADFATRAVARLQANDARAFEEYSSLRARLPGEMRGEDRAAFRKMLEVSLRSQMGCLMMDRFREQRWGNRFEIDGDAADLVHERVPTVFSFLHLAAFPLIYPYLRGTGHPVVIWRGAKPWLCGCYFEEVRRRADERCGLSGHLSHARMRDGLRPVLRHLKSGGSALMACDALPEEAPLRIPLFGGSMMLRNGPLRLSVASKLVMLLMVESAPFRYRIEAWRWGTPGDLQEMIGARLSGALEGAWSSSTALSSRLWSERMLKHPHPLLRILAGPSLFEEILREVERQPLAEVYSPLPGDLWRREDFDLVRPRFCPAGPVIRNALVSPRGVIFEGLRLSRYSAFYPYLHPRTVWKELRCCRRPQKTLDEAVFVTQQLVYKGSYGDYWDEFLTTFCARCPPGRHLVLLADNFAAPFALEDLKEVGYEAMVVPSGGCRVGQLSILTPAQFFNNYLPENIQALHGRFPARLCPEEERRQAGHAVYLSRRGFERPGFSCGGKVNRTLRNEAEVEDFLATRGFRILHPHAISNAALREALRGVHTVVAPHGAALFHTVWSPPESVIELAHPDWFLPSFMKLCHAMGVPHHRVLVAQGGVVDLRNLGAVLDEMG